MNIETSFDQYAKAVMMHVCSIQPLNEVACELLLAGALEYLRNEHDKLARLREEYHRVVAPPEGP